MHISVLKIRLHPYKNLTFKDAVKILKLPSAIAIQYLASCINYIQHNPNIEMDQPMLFTLVANYYKKK